MAIPERLSLQELTDAAGVSVRTVRYYIAEGLLPAPMGSGPASFYTPNHLRRLRLIARLKDAYLPLKEIRRRLEGVPDEAVAGLLDLEDAALFDAATWESLQGGTKQASSALRYIDRVLERQRPRALRESAPIPFRRQHAEPRDDIDWGGDWSAGDAAQWDAGEPDAMAPSEAPTPVIRRAMPPAASMVAPQGTTTRVVEVEADPEPERWRRIVIGPGVDLMVSEEVYERVRDKVDWLVRQARRVFA